MSTAPFQPEPERDDLTRVQELYDFLQGDVPEGYTIAESHVPQLTADQAWTVIWFLQNMYWQVPDYIERCEPCGDLYNSEEEGSYDEDGPPYNYCPDCEHTMPSQESEEDDD